MALYEQHARVFVKAEALFFRISSEVVYALSTPKFFEPSSFSSVSPHPTILVGKIVMR